MRTPPGIGAHFIVGIDGPVLLPAEAKLLSELKPAGIILFAKNLTPQNIIPGEDDAWVSHLHALIADCRQAAGDYDLLVSIDHEGGRVHRLRAPFTRFPPAAQWGDASEAVGRAMAGELRKLQVDLSYAPVVDLNTEVKNTVIGARAFSSDPSEAAERAANFMRGLHAGGVLGCGKHFPGHGGTVADSHVELPRLTLAREQIFAREIAAFRHFLARTAPPLLMTAHVVYPALDADFPATLSQAIVSGILRNELGYGGAVVTDDLEMSALGNLTPAQKAVYALKAGVDLLLEGNTSLLPSGALPLERAAEMAKGLQQALSSGELADSQLRASQSRITALFETWEQIRSTAQPTRVDFAAHQELAERIARG